MLDILDYFLIMLVDFGELLVSVSIGFITFEVLIKVMAHLRISTAILE